VTPCTVCGGSGIIAHAPEGETVYCEACELGLRRALHELEAHVELDRDWMGRHEEPSEEDQAYLAAELAEHGRLSALLVSIWEERLAARYVEEYA